MGDRAWRSRASASEGKPPPRARRRPLDERGLGVPRKPPSRRSQAPHQGTQEPGPSRRGAACRFVCDEDRASVTAARGRPHVMCAKGASVKLHGAPPIAAAALSLRRRANHRNPETGIRSCSGGTNDYAPEFGIDANNSTARTTDTRSQARHRPSADAPRRASAGKGSRLAPTRPRRSDSACARSDHPVTTARNSVDTSGLGARLFQTTRANTNPLVGKAPVWTAT
jgi:hypothetical protein